MLGFGLRVTAGLEIPLALPTHTRGGLPRHPWNQTLEQNWEPVGARQRYLGGPTNSESAVWGKMGP